MQARHRHTRQTPRDRRARLESLETRYCLSVFYDFDVVAQTQVAPFNFSALGQGVSINNQGYVAFEAESLNNDGQAADNIYAFSPATHAARALMNRVFMYPNAGAQSLTPGTQAIFGDVQINDNNDVLARRRLNASVQVVPPFGSILTAPLTYLETWNANAANPPGLPSAQVANGLPAGASASLWLFLNPATGGVYPSPINLASPYEGLFNASTINNSGQVNFSAIVRGAGNNRISSNTSGDLVLRGPIGSLAIEPMLADNGLYTFSTSDGRVFAEAWNGSSLKLLAGTTKGFTKVSKAGISDDGQMIVFAGNSTTEGEGIFVCIFNAATSTYDDPIKVLGIAVAGDGRADFGESWTDTNDNEKYDPGEVDLGGGFLQAVEYDTRPCISAIAASPGQYKIVFEGTDAEGRAGVYDIVFSLADLVVNGGAAPKKVIQVGDTVPGIAGTVKTLQLHDAVNSRGDVALWAEFTSGATAVVTGKEKTLDTDGDGLLDDWELHGIDYNGDGTPEITLGGADPRHKDLYVEVDAIAGFAPQAAALDDVAKAFGHAPADRVKNTDLKPGIELHYAPFDEWSIAGTGVFAAANPWIDFQAVKSAHFGKPGDTQDVLAAKKLVYRYALFGKSQGTDSWSGLAEIGGNDFMVTLGLWTTVGGTREQQAGTFMHELGHTLGLRHGGDDNIRYKPNYYSIMNYTWQTPIDLKDYSNPSMTLWRYANAWRLDYSLGNLNPLDEAALSEPGGIGGKKTIRVPIDYTIVPGPKLQLALVLMGGPADFNQNGTIDTSPVAADINYIDGHGASPGQKLHDYDDWANLQYGFRQSPASANGFADFDRQAEPDEAFYLELAQLLQDVPDPPAFHVTNTLDSGPGSLRQAILDANAQPHANLIDIDLAAGTQIVALASQLPALTEETTLKIPAGVLLQLGNGNRLPLVSQSILEIAGGGTLRLDGGRLQTADLLIDTVGGTTLDLATGSLVVDYTGGANPANDISRYLSSGINLEGTVWDGPGIVSSAARDDGTGVTALGMIDNQVVGYDTVVGNQFGYGLAGGEPLPANAVLLKYTYVGDADLNGRVDGDDLVSLLVGYGNRQQSWDAGDFDYSGAVDGDDLTSLLVAYSGQGTPLQAGPLAKPDRAVLDPLALYGLRGPAGNVAPAILASGAEDGWQHKPAVSAVDQVSSVRSTDRVFEQLTVQAGQLAQAQVVVQAKLPRSNHRDRLAHDEALSIALSDEWEQLLAEQA